MARLLTLAELAELIDAPTAQLARLVRARLLVPASTEGGRARYADSDYQHLRLCVDLLDAGMKMSELRAILAVRWREPTAARAAAALTRAIDRVLVPLSARLERQRRLREELIRTRDALHRCRSCHRPRAELTCHECGGMPSVPPRLLYRLFLSR